MGLTVCTTLSIWRKKIQFPKILQYNVTGFSFTPVPFSMKNLKISWEPISTMVHAIKFAL